MDRSYFYAVDNTSITKHSRETGAPLLQFAGVDGGPLIHMDSGAVGRWPAVRGALQLQRVADGELRGGLRRAHAESRRLAQLRHRPRVTHLDRPRHDGYWWAAFANYDRVFDGAVYGDTDNTQVVRMNDRFEVVAGYTIPTEILDRFRPMSNSGGSWGPDGRLWITGHDLGEAYVMEPPRAGSELRWIATVRLPGVEGQGIAWDLSGPRPTLWAIKRSTDRSSSSRCRITTSQSRPPTTGASTAQGTSSPSDLVVEAGGRGSSMRGDCASERQLRLGREAGSPRRGEIRGVASNRFQEDGLLATPLASHAVDGRAPGYSAGLNFEEEAAVMLALGAVDAVNLDGGGSTTMTVRGNLVTRPSDATGERPIADAMVVAARSEQRSADDQP